MRTQARKRIRLAVFLFLAALIGPSVWWMNRWYRQERLDHDLIAAVEKNDTVAAIALLNAGADPNTTRGDKPPSSLIDLLRDYRDRETEGG